MIRDTFRFYWQAMKPQWYLWLIAFLGHTAFFVVVNVLQPIVISRFIAEVSDITGKTLDSFWPIIWAWIGLHVAATTVGRIGIYTWFYATANTMKRIDLKSFEVTLSQSSDFFSNNFTGSLVNKFNRFTRSFEVIQKIAMFDLNSLLVQFVVPTIIISTISPTIAAGFFTWSLFFAVSVGYLHKRKMPKSRKVAEYDSRVTGQVADVITNVLPIKMFSSFRREYVSFEQLGTKRVKARLKNMIATDWIRLYKVLIVTILEVLVFYFTARLAIGGSIDVEGALLIQFYVFRIASSLWEFGKVIDHLEQAMSDSYEMTEIYKLQPSVLDTKNPHVFSSVKGDISLEKVAFMYEGDNESKIFKDLTMSVPSGQKVGFVGPSGGGKTTLTKLLLRFMDVDSGVITIDGIDISKVRQDDLREQIAYVPQEPLLFHRSIYENIAYGNPHANEEEVLKAAKRAHADEFIQDLPDGYNTLVGERGVKLSGGQKQRVAIARAMLKRAPILVLDEATSALDSKSEKHITTALDNLMKNRTTIVIAHRLSTIKKMDRIVVLDKGHVIEDGSHQELLKRKGLYKELWTHQHGEFIGD